MSLSNFIFMADNPISAGQITDDEEEISGMVCFCDVSQDLTEVLLARIENKRFGGGPIEDEKYDPDAKIMTVKFADKNVAENFLQKGTIEIKFQNLKIRRPDGSSVLYVHNIPTGVEEYVEDFLASKRLGGGDIAQYDYDAQTSCARVKFASKEVTARFLEKKSVVFDGHKLSFSCNPALGGSSAKSQMAQNHSSGSTASAKYQDDDEEGDDDVGNFYDDVADDDVSSDDNDEYTEKLSRSIVVEDVPNNMKVVVEAYLESKKYGGGDLEEFRKIDEGMLATFLDPNVAKGLIKAGCIKMKDFATLKVKAAELFHMKERSEDSDTASENASSFSETEEDNLTSRMILVSGIRKEKMDEDTLKLFLENKKKSGGAEISDFQLNRAHGTAVVTYMDAEVARLMLEKGNVKYLDGTLLTITKVNQNASSADGDNGSNAVDSEKIQLTGIPKKVDQEALKLFLENTKRSGGGELIDFTPCISQGIAVVTFKDPEVAKSWLKKGSVKYMDGTNIMVTKVNCDQSKDNVSHAAKESPSGASAEESRNVRISGLNSRIDDEALKLYFENKRSAGGEIRNFVRSSPEVAMIIFERPQDAVNVARKTDHSFGGAALKVELLDSTPDVQPLAVKVTGLKSKTERDLIELYFQSKRAGGGEFEDCLIDENTGTAVIIYPSAEIAKAVANNRNLSLNGSALKAELILPAPPPPRVLGQDIDPTLLFFTGILPLGGGQVDETLLRNYLESAGKATIRKFSYMPIPGNMLVQFSSEPDYENLRIVICSRPIQGTMITVQRVARPSAIQVHKISGIEEDYLKLYFENEKKSGGGDLSSCDIREKQDCAILKFQDRQVMERILSRRHIISNKEIRVEPYLDCIGILPSGFDTSRPFQPLPQDIHFKAESEILHFLKKNAGLKASLEKTMNQNHCNIKWPSKWGEALTLQCALQQGSSEAYGLSTVWAEKSRAAVAAELSKYQFLQIDILQDIWDEVEKEYKNLTLPNKDRLLSQCSREKHTVFLCGFKEEVEKLEQKIKRIATDKEEILEKAKKSIKERVQLNNHKCYLIQNFRNFPGNVQITFQDDGLELFGQSADVKKVKMEIIQQAANMDEKFVNGASKAKCEFLNRPAVSQKLKELFKKSSLQATLVAKEKDIRVYGMNDKDSKSATDIVEEEILEKSLTLEDPNLAKGRDWKDFRDDLNAQFELYDVRSEGNQLVVVAFKNEFDNIMRRVEDYIGNNAVQEKFLPFEEGVVELIKKYDLENCRNTIKKKYPDAKIEISWKLDNRPGFTVRGLASDLQSACDDISKRADEIKSKYHNIEPSQVRAIKNNELMINGIAEKYRAIIKHCAPENKGVREKRLVESRVYKVLKFNSGTVKLIVGDITSHRVDVIVNAANERLDHISGVAGAIVEAGGKEIQEECHSFISLSGSNLTAGKVYISTAGRLSYKKIVHAVGPVWSGGKRGEERLLDNTIKAALKAAESIPGVKSISLPFIGCGHFKFPKPLGAVTILKSIKEYYKAGGTLSEVHIVLKSSEDADIFVKHISALSGEEEGLSASGGAEDKEEEEDFEVVDPEQTRGASGGGFLSSKSSENSLTTQEGITVTIKKGIIAREKADVIVNTTGRDLNLTKGAISSSLLKAAGPELQNQLTTDYPSGLRAGQIGQTKGYKLDCRQVFHATCLKWSHDGKSEQVLKKIVMESLNLAHKQQLKTIAFPTIGCGRLGYPPESVAEIMFDEVRRFSATTKSASVTNVAIVVYEEDGVTYDKFESVLQQLKSGGQEPRPAPRSRPSGGSRGGDVGCLEQTIDKVIFRVKQGNIVDEKSDAIVNSTNERFNLSSGALSKAIVSGAGRAVVEECSALGGLKNGMARSTGGNLHCKYIYHLFAREPSAWKSVVTRCLKDADGAGLTSISLPPLGTGRAHSSIADQANALFSAIKSFAGDKPKSLLAVTIVVHDKEMLGEFIDALINTESSSGGVVRKGPSGESRPSPSPKPRHGEHMTGPSRASSQALIIYAFREIDIENVLKEISNISAMKSINLRELGIFELPLAQRSKIMELESKYSVSITVSHSEIRVQGDKNDLADTMQAIHKMLSEFKDNEHSSTRNKEMEILGQKVHWEYEDASGKYKLFDPLNRGIIESAHIQKKPSVEIKSGRTKYKIDLKSMTEEIVGKSDKKYKIRRTEQHHTKLPRRWDPMPEGKVYLAVSLASGSEEYQAVAKGLPTIQTNIVKIERIQNPTLYRQYMSRKKDMDIVNGSSSAAASGSQSNERRLWHGTAGDNVEKINKTNFNRSYAGQHGVAIGNGVYFATDPQYSINGYCRPDANQLKHIYQARVLTGRYTQGSAGLKEPPSIAGSEHNYDSVVNSVANPGMFVVFYDPQTYPEYLITFR